MKKILILVDKIGPKKRLFSDLISKKIGSGVEVKLARFADLAFYISVGHVEVTIEEEDITNYNLVYFRRAGCDFSIMAATLASALDFLGINYIDRTFGNIGPLGSKMTSLVRLATGGLPIIPTFYCWNEKIKDQVQQITERFEYPLVAKELGTQLGRGVYKIAKKADFYYLPLRSKNKSENQYLFQKMIGKQEEFRLLVLGDKVAVAERKIAAKDEFRSNVALGAKEEFFDPSKLSEEVKDIAVKAAQLLKIDVAGVDILIEANTHKPWLLEVNRGPGFTYNDKQSPEMDELAKFLSGLLK